MRISTFLITLWFVCAVSGTAFSSPSRCGGMAFLAPDTGGEFGGPELDELSDRWTVRPDQIADLAYAAKQRFNISVKVSQRMLAHPVFGRVLHRLVVRTAYFQSPTGRLGTQYFIDAITKVGEEKSRVFMQEVCEGFDARAIWHGARPEGVEGTLLARIEEHRIDVSILPILQESFERAERELGGPVHSNDLPNYLSQMSQMHPARFSNPASHLLALRKLEYRDSVIKQVIGLLTEMTGLTESEFQMSVAQRLTRAMNAADLTPALTLRNALGDLLSQIEKGDRFDALMSEFRLYSDIKTELTQIISDKIEGLKLMEVDLKVLRLMIENYFEQIYFPTIFSKVGHRANTFIEMNATNLRSFASEAVAAFLKEEAEAKRIAEETALKVVNTPVVTAKGPSREERRARHAAEKQKGNPASDIPPPSIPALAEEKVASTVQSRSVDPAHAGKILGVYYSLDAETQTQWRTVVAQILANRSAESISQPSDVTTHAGGIYEKRFSGVSGEVVLFFGIHPQKGATLIDAHLLPDSSTINDLVNEATLPWEKFSKK